MAKQGGAAVKEKDKPMKVPDWYHADGFSRAKLDMPGEGNEGGQVCIKRYTSGVQDRVREIYANCPEGVLERATSLRKLVEGKEGETSGELVKSGALKELKELMPTLRELAKARHEQLRSAVTAWPANWFVEELVEVPDGKEMPKSFELELDDKGQIAPKPLPIPRLHHAWMTPLIIGLIPDENAAARIYQGIDILMASVAERYGEKNLRKPSP